MRPEARLEAHVSMVTDPQCQEGESPNCVGHWREDHAYCVADRMFISDSSSVEGRAAGVSRRAPRTVAARAEAVGNFTAIPD